VGSYETSGPRNPTAYRRQYRRPNYPVFGELPYEHSLVRGQRCRWWRRIHARCRVERAPALTRGGWFRVQGAERMVQGAGFRVQGAGCRVQGAGFRVQGAGFRVQGSGCRVQGSGFRVQGAGFRVQGSGCRVQGSGKSTSPHDPSNRYISKDRNIHPLVQISRMDGQTHGIQGRYKVHPRSEIHVCGPSVRVAESCTVRSILDLRTTTSQKCESVPRRARI
jgi:hypothetical protein